MGWKVRDTSDAVPDGCLTPDYGTNVEFFTIKWHHSGKFVRGAKLSYEGGEISHIDYVNVDELSKIEVDSMAAAIGLKGDLDYYYSLTGVDDVDILEPIKCDSHALNLGLFHEEIITRVAGIFVDHEGLPMLQIICPPEEPEDIGGGSGNVQGNDQVHEQGEGSGSGSGNVQGSGSGYMDFRGLIDPDSGESDGEVSVGSDSEVSDCLGDSDGMYDLDNREFDKYVDSDEEWGGLNPKDPKDPKGKKPCTIPEKKEQVPSGGTEGVGNKKITLSLGKCFLDAEEFRKAVRCHAIQLGRELDFSINNKFKVQAKCKNEKCDWLVYASRGKRDDTFIIKTLFDKHNCPRLNKVVHANSTFLAEKYAKQLRLNPKWPVSAMMAQFEDENKVEFSTAQIYRCKKKVANEGDEADDQYSFLWNYAEEILTSNPCTTCRIKCKDVGGEIVFKRMYLCWDALKRGMLDGNRRIICLGGCHLKTIHGGVLLTAVGIDSNNGIYPFAYAIVEKEKKKSWMWFLDLVITDLKIENSSLWTVISDKQKGLVDAVEYLLPSSEHRFCLMHLWQNFKMAHKGMALKNLLWRAARATRVVDFNRAMVEFKARNTQAFEWLQKRDPKHWSRSHFSCINKSDLMYNNISESFNSMVLYPRTKPIVQMLEGIRLILMLRIGVQRKEMLKHPGEFCPVIEAILDANKEKSHSFKPIWNGRDEFNVEYSHTVAFKVHLGEKNCSCRRWDLTGIPCAHAISCMYYMGYKPEEYIDECYKKDTYVRVYSHFMHPLRSKDEWEAPEGERHKIHPPRVGRMPGRPKKHARKLQPGERRPSQSQSQRTAEDGPHQPKRFGRLSRKGLVMNCKICGGAGHNSRTCGKKKRGEGLEIPAANPEKVRRRRRGTTGPANANNENPNIPEVRRRRGTTGEHNLEDLNIEQPNLEDHNSGEPNLEDFTQESNNNESHTNESHTEALNIHKYNTQEKGKGKMQRGLSFKASKSPTKRKLTLGPTKLATWFDCSKGSKSRSNAAKVQDIRSPKKKIIKLGGTMYEGIRLQPWKAIHIPGEEQASECKQQ